MRFRRVYIKTCFWDDNWITDLDPARKLLFLYLITNASINGCGIYEIQLRRISFDTGLDESMIKASLMNFELAGKAAYVNGYIIVKNFIKNQPYNPNMIESIIRWIEKLPRDIKSHPFFREAANQIRYHIKKLKIDFSNYENVLTGKQSQ